MYKRIGAPSQDYRIEEINSDSVETIARPSFEVLYRKRSSKKHKVWEGDAVAVFKDKIYLIKDGARVIASVPSAKLVPGACFEHGSNEFEVGAKLNDPAGAHSNNTYNSNESSQTHISTPTAPRRPVSVGLLKPLNSGDNSLATLLSGKNPTLPNANLDTAGCINLKKTFVADRLDEPSSPDPSEPSGESSPALESRAFIPETADLSKKVEVNLPARKRKKVDITSEKVAAIPERKQKKKPKAQNPAPVKRSGPKSAAELFGNASTPVVASIPETKEWRIPEDIAKVLRPHQVEAVQFLYRCVMGKQHVYGNGAILADDMGLGKTLTSIALIYSLLQGDLVTTVLITCPATLVKNWRNEFKKWIPHNRIGVFAYTPGEDIKVFCKAGTRRTYSVMIAGYERIRSISPIVENEMGTFDLVICDEGHRLKSSESKTWSSLESISGNKRVILTGTPIQNNLEEFWSMAEYVNAGIFGKSISKFTRNYSGPIQAGRAIDASTEAKSRGRECMNDLAEITNEFCLRREQDVLAGHITVPKTECLVFCRPLEEQRIAYETELADTYFWEGSSSTQSLQLITKLRKISTSCQLVKKSATLKGSFHQQLETMNPLKGSNKLEVLKAMLMEIYTNTDEKVVIVSGYTETLDLVQQLCGKLDLSWLRLDGSTPQNKRQPMVDLFNGTPQARSFAFILSARSGGCGLNLIGASRLFMLDCDWNPSTDLQAMARVHRDGQKRPTHIYRLLSTGTIDEKILQRQITKNGVSNSMFEMGHSGENKFTCEQLREIFAFKTCMKSDTLEQGIGLEYQEVSEYEPTLKAGIATKLISCVVSK